MSEEEQPQPSTQLMNILEGAIFAAGEPLSVQKMQTLFDTDEVPEKEQILEALAAIKTSCEGRGIDLIEVASGWRFQVREGIAQWVNRLWEEKPQKYSRALLETLALIAYRQPITRGDIEEVRGVAVSSHIIKTLSERDWIKSIGHRDVPGRPALYATTKTFLDYFNLKSLDELPTLGELKDIESLNKNLEFEASPEDGASSEGAASADESDDANAEANIESDSESSEGDRQAEDEQEEKVQEEHDSNEEGNVTDDQTSDAEDVDTADNEASDIDTSDDALDEQDESSLPEDSEAEDSEAEDSEPQNEEAPEEEPLEEDEGVVEDSEARQENEGDEVDDLGEDESLIAEVGDEADEEESSQDEVPNVELIESVDGPSLFEDISDDSPSLFGGDESEESVKNINESEQTKPPHE